MPKALFRVLPESGHMNASFELARELNTRGYQVAYASVSEHEDAIEAQGFAFYRLESEVGWTGGTRFTAKRNRSPIVWLRKQIGRYQGLKYRRSELLNSNVFIEEIERIRPDLVFIDSTFLLYAIPLLKTGIPFAIIESQVRPDYCRYRPPPISYHVPNDSLTSKIRCWIEWTLYFASRRGLQFLRMHPMESKAFMRKLCKTAGTDIKEIDFKRCFRIGLRAVPEVFLSTQELDFPREPKSNQIYIKTQIEQSRTESSYDYKFDQTFSDIRATKQVDPAHKLVYCSMGGMSFRYIGVEAFFKRLIDACREISDLTLILSIGNELKIESFESESDSIHVFRRVPQLRVLDASDLMVMHGGTNSITECILAGVPMLAYPGSVDQPGNAARMVYHGMGLMGVMARVSTNQLQKNIKTILSDETFRTKVLEKRQEIESNSTPEKIDASIDNMLRLMDTTNK